MQMKRIINKNQECPFHGICEKIVESEEHFLLKKRRFCSIYAPKN